MRRLWLWGLVLWAALCGPLWAEGRHALVVGQDRYAHLPPLKKAVNDAKSVAAALERAGFATDLVLDADVDHLLTALSAFGSRLSPGDEAVFFFAGHGVEIDGQNYLLPTDMPAVEPGRELVLKRRSLVLDDVLAETTARGVRVSLLIIDACRDNPFPKQGGRSAGSTRGLARVDPPQGTFVLYSAGAGQTALDRLGEEDSNPNSVFTRALLPQITEPGRDLRSMVQDLRTEVRKTAARVRHDQFPAIYDQLEGAFSFMPAAAAATAAAPTGPQDLCTRARDDWDLVQTTKSAEVLGDYLSLYADCKLMAGLARERLAALGAPAPVPAKTPTPAVKAAAATPPPPKATTPPTPAKTPVLTVAPDGKGDFHTIKAAVAAAKPGTRIEIRPGRYRGGVIIDKPLDLIGVGNRAGILWETSREHLILWRAASGKIENMTLQQTSVASKSPRAAGFSTVVFDKGSATLESNVLSSTDDDTIVVTGKPSNALINGNTISGGRRNGITIKYNGRARIHENTIRHNGGAGIAIVEDGVGTVIRNQIANNKFGIVVKSRAQGLLFYNSLAGNGYKGLQIEKGAGKVIDTGNLK